MLFSKHVSFTWTLRRDIVASFIRRQWALLVTSNHEGIYSGYRGRFSKEHMMNSFHSSFSGRRHLKNPEHWNKPGLNFNVIAGGEGSVKVKDRRKPFLQSVLGGPVRPCGRHLPLNLIQPLTWILCSSLAVTMSLCISLLACERWSGCWHSGVLCLMEWVLPPNQAVWGLLCYLRQITPTSLSLSILICKVEINVLLNSGRLIKQGDH